MKAISETQLAIVINTFCYCNVLIKTEVIQLIDMVI